jgi:hypothetical protein
MLAGAGAAAATTNPASSGGATIGLAPASSTGLAADGAWFEPSLRPGASGSYAVKVQNLGGKPVRVELYAVSGATEPTSGIVYSGASSTAGGASWIAIATPRLTVPAHAIKDVAFRLKVPAGTKPGQYVAGIAAEPVYSNASSNKADFGVNIQTRIVVAVVADVPGALHSRYQVGRPALSGGNGLPATITIPLANRGNELTSPTLHVVVIGHGKSVHITRPLQTFVPGSTIKYPLTTGKPMPAGHYHIKACATLNSAPQGCSSGTGTLKSPAPPRQILPPIGPTRVKVIHQGVSRKVLIEVVAGIVALVVLVGILIAVLIVRTRPRKKKRSPSHATKRPGGAQGPKQTTWP